MGLNLAGGVLSAASRLTLTTARYRHLQRLAAWRRAEPVRRKLRNLGGKLTSSGDATIQLGGMLDNTGGMIAAAGKAAQSMAGGNLTITTSGAIDNQRGLLQADDTLTLTASSLDNSNTLTASNAPAKGVLGKVVSIVAGA